MPLYYFILKAGCHTYPDREGQEFPDDAAARAHAHAVARELMRNRESSTAHWRIQVCDDYLQPRYDCLFVDVDRTPGRFDSDFRSVTKTTAPSAAALRESMCEIDAEMNNLRQMIGQMASMMSHRPPG
ncbi:hypothetical protein J6524_31845 [Bradyrhizobium sp. WSM 1738]|uniref:DUF6894 family protein n=1 Tax=Bradyrhizobium hereditatis TaxID=2821405 RepID=UPI001CE275E0|nr:hypothetical protein [Bradyrhizobium hereditatis]MCA6119432.1 hypothetical protein [Bradyrhizobium hereditatis]